MTTKDIFSIFILDLGRTHVHIRTSTPHKLTHTTLRFSDMKEFLSVRDDQRFSNVISKTSCLVTVAWTDRNEEVSQLITFMKGINVNKKQLQVIMSSRFESNRFLNQSINFNVVVEHLTTGA